MLNTTEVTDGMVCAAAGGSHRDLERVLEAVGPQIRLMVAARFIATPGQFHATDEVTQQVMVALTTGISRLERQTVDGLKAYLSGIVVRKVSDLLKHRGDGRGGRHVVRSLDSTVVSVSDAGPLWQFLSGSGTSPLSAAQRADQTAKLISELGKLKPEHREVITLAFFDQLPTAEVAKRMGVSRPAASMLLVRAVQKLRRSMAASADSGADRLSEGRAG
ncbi:MAG: sigma-70 family RNA polymerase sigma factor [Sedimentisphaerales bacterium]|nr:sigma-70 family RNA polymerase sigma factor [Sedimentisphaerales bacterium]